MIEMMRPRRRSSDVDPKLSARLSRAWDVDGKGDDLGGPSTSSAFKRHCGHLCYPRKGIIGFCAIALGGVVESVVW